MKYAVCSMHGRWLTRVNDNYKHYINSYLGTTYLCTTDRTICIYLLPTINKEWRLTLVTCKGVKSVVMS